MRVWDIPVEYLCNKHLIAQHGEIHAIYSIITNGWKGYAHHPEVTRWRGHLDYLKYVHLVTAMEMADRGIKHNLKLGTIDSAPMGIISIDGWPAPLQSIEEQQAILRSRECACPVCPDCRKGIKHIHRKEG